MPPIQKTNVNISPLLKPVIERDYTKGIGSVNIGDTNNVKQPQPQDLNNKAPDTGNLNPEPDFSPPPPPPPGTDEDFTKPFSFEEETDTSSDLKDGESGPGVAMPAGSAKAFANWAGNALQIYLPKATYGYSKVDIENVIINVQKGVLHNQWIDIFEKINKNTEEALKIPDENIKMWKAAFKEYLEYKQMSFANPETAFWGATILLLLDQGVRTIQIKKANEGYVKEAINASNPGMFKGTSQPQNNKQEENQTNTQKDGEPIAA